MIFSLMTKQSEVMDAYMQETQKRLQSNDFIKNPFKGEIKGYDIKESTVYICKIEPIYPNFSYLGLIGIASLYWFGFNWSFYVGLVIMFTGFFWTRWFFIMMLRLGSRRMGYQGYIRSISSDTIMELICFG